MPKGGNTNRIRHSAEQSHRSECNTSPEEFGLQVRCHDLFCFLNDCKRRMRNPDWDFPVWTPYCSDQRLTVLARDCLQKNRAQRTTRCLSLRRQPYDIRICGSTSAVDCTHSIG